jgi:hypothetical protein
MLTPAVIVPSVNHVPQTGPRADFFSSLLG